MTSRTPAHRRSKPSIPERYRCVVSGDPVLAENRANNPASWNVCSAETGRRPATNDNEQSTGVLPVHPQRIGVVVHSTCNECRASHGLVVRHQVGLLTRWHALLRAFTARLFRESLITSDTSIEAPLQPVKLFERTS